MMKKNILLVASGSVAVKKTHKLFNLLKKDFKVKVIATPYVKKNYKLEMKIEEENKNLLSFPLHIKHAKWADLIVVAPASANTLVKFCYGLADNQVLSTLIAARTKILFAPAMNTFMYKALKKRKIINQISTMGNLFIGPNVGKLWEGENGLGRMSEPLEILKAIKNYLKGNDKKIVITNGASKVMIDPIRYISSNASGLMGKMLANELRLKGFNVKLIDVSNWSSEELINKLKKMQFDIYISVAAINNFKINKLETKIKKQDKLTLEFHKSVDVLSVISKLNKKIIAFKHDNIKENAIKKLKVTKGEFIVWNKIGSMGNNLISGAIIFKNGKEMPFEEIPKNELAKIIAQEIY